MSEGTVISELRGRAVLSVVEIRGLVTDSFECMWSASSAGKHGESARYDCLGRRSNMFILSVDIPHELSDRFVRREQHSDFHGHAGIRNLSGGAMADPMRPDVCDPCLPASGLASNL